MDRRLKFLSRVLYYTLQWTWGLLPNLLGLTVRLYLLLKHPEQKSYFFFGARVTDWATGSGSMGIGMFIFMGHKGEPIEGQVLVHEYGHTWQSALLGPFFLLIIGLPSLLWAGLPVCRRLRERKKIRYVDFYPEAWANAWGSKATGMSSLKQ